jgi:hypothetical protein
MSRMLKLKTMVATGLCALTAHASALVLPGANEITATQYGDFVVYSLDLLEQCFNAGDPRCAPFEGTPPPAGTTRVDSGPGQLQNKIVIMTGPAGNQVLNYDNSGPYAGLNPAVVQVDNPFNSDSGGSTTYNFNAAIEPVEPGVNQNPFPDATLFGPRDVAGRWDAQLSSIVDVIGAGNGIMFFFDNNQQGGDLAQQQFFWANLQIVDGTGGLVDQFCLTNAALPQGTFNSGSNACAPAFVDYTSIASPGSFVGSGGGFCVDEVSGESFLLAGNAHPTSAGQCTAVNPGSYFVNNNLGQSTAEFAAYVQRLNDNLALWAGLGYYMTIDFKMRNLNDGQEQIWIESMSLPRQLPVPGTLALAGLALLAAAGVARRRRD